MENCIFDENTNDTIGFYKDLVAGLGEQVRDFVKEKDYEMAQEIMSVLADLEKFKESDNLLVLSDNNGMGYTVREYEKGE